MPEGQRAKQPRKRSPKGQAKEVCSEPPPDGQEGLCGPLHAWLRCYSATPEVRGCSAGAEVRAARPDRGVRIWWRRSPPALLPPPLLPPSSAPPPCLELAQHCRGASVSLSGARLPPPGRELRLHCSVVGELCLPALDVLCGTFGTPALVVPLQCLCWRAQD